MDLQAYHPVLVRENWAFRFEAANCNHIFHCSWTVDGWPTLLTWFFIPCSCYDDYFFIKSPFGLRYKRIRGNWTTPRVPCRDVYDIDFVADGCSYRF